MNFHRDAVACQGRTPTDAEPSWTAVSTARVAATVDGETFDTSCGPDGEFVLPLPHGEAVIEVVSQAHLDFRVHETLAADEKVEVRYLLERTSYNPYETVVIGTTGYTGRELFAIADRLGVSFATVRTHVYNVFQKTGAGSRVDLLRLASGFRE